MMNILEEMGILRSEDWRNAFATMEARAAQSAATRQGPFVYFGELDCPEEMLRYPTVTSEMVRYAGKTNWLATLDGQFITVGDAELDCLIDAGKVLSDYPKISKGEYENLTSVEDRIAYRMEHQHIDERTAKELVSYEYGFNAFKYRFVVRQTYTIENQDGERSTTQMDEEIEADSPLEALELAKTYNGWYVGLNIRVGQDFSIGAVKLIRETIVHLDSEIIETIEL